MRHTALAIVFVLATARAAVAQVGANPRVFVEGSIFASVESHGHAEQQGLDSGSLPIATLDLSGTVPGATLAIGSFVAPRFSVRLEFAIPGGLVRSSTETQSIGLLRYSATERDEYRSWSGAVLAGYHPAKSGRVELGYLGGVAFIRERVRVSSDRVITGLPVGSYQPVPVGIGRARRLRSVTYRAAPEVGFDAAILLGSGVSLVPQIRAAAAAGVLSIRPGVAVRWGR